MYNLIHMAIDIENGEAVRFHCTVCFNDFTTIPTKYKCTNCDKQTCDTCFLTVIRTKQECVFCRGKLEITEEDIPIPTNNGPIEHISRIKQLCFDYRFQIYFTISITIVWYVIFFFCWLLIKKPK